MATAAQKRSRRRLLELACICLAVAQLGWFVFPLADTLRLAELNVRDKLVAGSGGGPSVKEFVFVAIDDPSLKLELWPEDIAQSPTLKAIAPGWPWPRSVYADAIERILGAGAKLVIFDLIFDAPKPGDEILKAALDRHAKQVVLGSNLSFDSFNPDHPEWTPPSFRMPAPTLVEKPDQDPRVGFVNFFPDPDDQYIRSALYATRSGTKTYHSLSAASANLLGLADRIPADGRSHPFRYGDMAKLKVVPFYTLFLPRDWQISLKNGAVFKDKIVIVGPSAAIMHDVHLTPLDVQLPGPLLHVNALAAAMGGHFYDLPGSGTKAVGVLLASLAAWLLTVYFRNPLAAVGTLLVACAALVLGAWAVAAIFNLILPVVQPGSVLLTAGVACIAWNFAQERRESGRMRSMLERYISRNLVREVLDHRDDFLSKLGGTRQPMTVFFSDVRGFTSFAEREDASAVVEQLNEYLGEMVNIIFRHHGTVDKFMGDGIMAVWGNVVSEGPAKDAARAVDAALDMLERLGDLNEKWAARELPRFAIGIGLHHGEAVFGNIGSAEKMEPTVIGDTVNLTSRVEGLTKKYGVTLCVTQPLAELVRDHFLFRSVDLVQVVGKSRPVEILTVLGRRGAPPPEWLPAYEAAIADFRARRFAEAAAQFRLCLTAAPDDKLLGIYLARSEAFLVEPPPPDWNGAEIATSK